ncbi:hypothetical protein [Actinotignum urinale]|uniref:hypothetical protein n=1 Tax=Actinotignum urinale TaxID=190146 RepID=UPI0012EB49AD|nr:hypothetical protein [Actinotignum urinale]MDY5159568.1 hypothetical protein [Actinotignum urinale]
MNESLPNRLFAVIQQSVGDVKVFDGVPAVNLKDRPVVHVIVTMPSGIKSFGYVSGDAVREDLTFQTMVVVRSGAGMPVSRMGGEARHVAGLIRDGLLSLRVPNMSRVEHLVERASTDAPGIASHEVFTVVSQFRVRA